MRTHLTPFWGGRSLRSFIEIIKSANNEDEVNRVHQESEHMRTQIDRNVMTKADNAFSNLKGSLLHRIRGLNEPVWSESLKYSKKEDEDINEGY